MATTNGLAKVGATIINVSSLIDTGLKGIHAFLGETEKGVIGKTVLVGSWSEYVANFGGLLDNSDFPLLCKRSLDAGCRLRIARAVHYTDVTDKTTITGLPASLIVDTDGTVSATSLGIWGNVITFNTTDPASGEVGYFDLQVTEGTNTETIAELNTVLTVADINAINAQSTLVVFSMDWVGKDISTVFPIADVAKRLVGGVNSDDIELTDLLGDPSQAIGIYAFDNDSDFVKISVPTHAIGALDSALTAYATTRKDCRAILRTPLGISGATAIEYRTKTGAYAGEGAVINSWFASMVYGTIEIVHPVTGGMVQIPALADVSGNYGNKDNTQYSWFTAGGPKRGLLTLGGNLQYNLGSPARSAEADNVAVNGINPVIADKDFGLVYWGNRTLSKGDDLLRYDNVADLLIFLVRGILPLAKTELFEPNDIQTWATIYRKVRPLLELVKTKRGIWDYKYEGDQFIDTLDQAVVNTSANIDAGIYNFIVWIKPKVGLNYIGFKISVTNSDVSFEEVTGETL